MMYFYDDLIALAFLSCYTSDLAFYYAPLYNSWYLTESCSVTKTVQYVYPGK